MSYVEDESPPVLLPCAICSRTFRPEVLERHVKVCEKTASKKRRVFDSFKNRVSGTELEEFLGPAPLPGQVQKRPAKSPVKKRAPSKWKETHENLIAVLRAARGVEPPPDAAPEFPKHGGNEQCPSCNRFFGFRAFDRHVEFCKEKTARIKMTPSKVSQAQERLEARTKYRAPLSIKPKLTTKEKYSPMLPRKESTESCVASTLPSKTSPPIPTLSRNAKPVKQTSNFSRQSPVRSSERQRSVSPTKKSAVSNSKSVSKNEAQAKISNQPKIKERLKSPEDLRPKSGIKHTAQENIRSSNLKLEDESLMHLSKRDPKTRQKCKDKSNLPSDDESSGTVESEFEKVGKQNNSFRSRWSSAESICKPVLKTTKKNKEVEEDDKTILELAGKEQAGKFKPKTRDSKSGKRNGKAQQPQINDLSVNDETFGIFVAACSVRPPSSNAKVNKEHMEKTKHEERKEKLNKSDVEKVKKERLNEFDVEDLKKEKMNFYVEDMKNKKSEKSSTKHHIKPSMMKIEEINHAVKLSQELKTKKTEKIIVSRIPKAKPEILNKFFVKKVENLDLIDPAPEVEPEILEKSDDAIEDPTSNIRKNAKKWHNISEMTTEELVALSEDFNLPEDDTSQELSESAIWEIAGEQFLKSEDSTHNTSIVSLDFLNENEKNSMDDTSPVEKKKSGGDDFIVLHVTDPSKMMENDADMKLSLSEPCFPYSDKKHKIPEKSGGRHKLEIPVFTAIPNALQRKKPHFKQRKFRKLLKPKSIPKLSYIREKTFLANDFPKAKRRKIGEPEIVLHHNFDLSEYVFETTSREVYEEKKKNFIENLKSQRGNIQKWRITPNSHVNFTEKFGKSIEDDLKELKYLFKGKKTRRKSYSKEFETDEELKKKKINTIAKKKIDSEVKKPEFVGKLKKFEYFEINLEDEKLEKETDGKDLKFLEKPKVKAAKEISIVCEKQNQPAVKKFESFEIPVDSFPHRKAREKTLQMESLTQKENDKTENNITDTEKIMKVKTPANLEENQKKITEETSLADSEDVRKKDLEMNHSFVHVANHQSSSLENIEEVDEDEEKNVEFKETFKNDIEIEDFIIAKPDAQKIFSKDENYLDELFPKTRKITETVTSAESATAVQLSFAADSVYDLKSEEEKKLKSLPEIPPRNNSKRILQKRLKKESQLPKISVKDYEKKENSMLTLLEMWQNKKKGKLEKEKICKIKATLPSGKLTPLTNENSFQIAALPLILKKKLSDLINDRIPNKNGSNDSYDPFKQAERQMLALLSWPSTADIKSAKNLTPKPKTPTQQKTNLETSPTSAFTKYPNKDEKSLKNGKGGSTGKKLPNETFEVNETAKKNSKNDKQMYTAADDWEEIFEKHFDLNRNEMTEQMTRSVKSALDGLLKNSLKNNSNMTDSLSTPQKNKTDLTEESIITEVLYTSTPKQSAKSDKSPKSRSKDSTTDFDRTQNTYRKNSSFSYGRITPPDDFNDSYNKEKREEKTNRNSGISLSSLSFCSQISDTTLADEEVMRSNLEIIGKAAAAAASRTPRRKYARSQSVFDERNKMLFAKTYDPNCTSSDDNDVEVLPKIIDKSGKVSPSRNPYPKSVPSHFSRSQSVVENRCKGDGDHSDDGDHISSPESNRNRKAKLSGDSAYSSLNRRSPKKNVLQNQQEDRLSSSGSEHSFPAVNVDFDPKSKPFDKPTLKKDQPVKMSKFCHECGSKYPVSVAKFCCECGVRRLII